VDLLVTPVPGAVELVERKGLGHPDTICDALAERLSRALSAFYLARFGVILHHNVDKALLVGGVSRPSFGGGEIVEPIEIHLAGRAVTDVEDVHVPVTELAVEGSREWLRAALPNLDVDRDVRIHVHVRPGSLDLSSLFRRRDDIVPLANDTSFGVGFAPLSALEQTVLSVERSLNARAFRERHPAGGEDVKVMALREEQRVSFTVARAFVGRHLADLDAYQAEKAALERAISDKVSREFPGAEVRVNASDGADAESVYLTVSGTSAEAGDDGEVGRGNRVNGLITPYRPMSLEAAAGKNAVSHVGKLYNLAANEIAEMLCRELVADVAQAEVFLSSRIGDPITDPHLVHVRLGLRQPDRLAAIELRVREVVRHHLSRVAELWQRVVHGDLEVY